MATLRFSHHAAAVVIIIVVVAVEGNPASPRKIAARDCRDDEITFLIGDA